MPHITDTQRKALEAALLLALLTRHTEAARQAYAHLGNTDADPTPDASVHQRLATLAAETALLMQTGSNKILAGSEGSVYADQTPEERVAGIDAHNRSVIAPYLDSSAAHSGLKTAYDATPGPNGRGSMTGAVQWTWQQNTTYPDDCAASADASPSSYDNLVSIAGSEPPAHRNCSCTLTPEDWPNP